jgi:hypothetical protein
MVIASGKQMDRYKGPYKIGILLLLTSVFILIGINTSMAANTTEETRLMSTDGLTDEAVCLPCHGSKKFAGDPAKPDLFIRKDNMKKSLHKDVKCLDCHTDLIEFARIITLVDKVQLIGKPTSNKHIRLTMNLGFSHITIGPKLYMTANLSCQNCKEHKQQGKDYFSSIHGFKAVSESLPKTPMCSTCHGSHYINNSYKKDKTFLAGVRGSAKSLCGKCHQKYFESYDDSYHGMPYKSGSKDAPVCWDCHGVHMVRDGKDPESLVSKKNIVKTCGKCHKDCDDVFVGYSPMIHNRQRLLSNNPVVKLKDRVVKWYKKSLADRIEKEYIDPIQAFLSLKYKEYLRGRDESVEIPTRMN